MAELTRGQLKGRNEFEKLCTMSDDPEVFAVILAGGSGTRFWPASRRLRPKQLLPLGPSAPKSLIAATAERLAPLVDDSHLLISTGAHLVEATRAELPRLPLEAFLAEPQAKNTAPCIAWAAAVVARSNPDAVVCVVPSDQYARDAEGFADTMRKAIRSAQAGSITTVGVVPTRAETGYGYIQRGEQRADDVFEVVGFVEKPDSAKAEQYLSSGEFYWNAGIFVFRASDMLSAIKRHAPTLSTCLDRLQEELSRGDAADESAVKEYFESCVSISIDYAVMEKQEGLSVVPGDFGWSDLGSWQSSWELSERDAEGNAGPPETVFVDSRDNLVEDLRTSAEGKAIALVGVSGLCVVETDDALLVMPTERSQDVRQVVARLKDKGRSDLV